MFNKKLHLGNWCTIMVGDNEERKYSLRLKLYKTRREQESIRVGIVPPACQLYVL